MVDIVYVTKIDHLYTLQISIKKITELYNVGKIYIITDKRYFSFFKFKSKVDIKLVDQDSVLPNMVKNDLDNLTLPYFPRRAGWYFQQLLKLGISTIDSINENYIVIDADTIFLQNLPFVNSKGQFVFLKATEYHKSYFDNYRILLGEEPNREFSFISQYMVFNKNIVKKLFSDIENKFNGESTWNWLIMKKIQGTDASLFSEYETYGHYVKNHYPNQCEFITKEWLREGSEYLKTTAPSEKAIESLSDTYCLVSFELRSKGIFNKISKVLFHKIYPLFNYVYTKQL
jgi:hypothetical protein